MILITHLLLGLGLSIDSGTVAVTVGICHGQIQIKHALKVGLVFGFFQALMTAAGYLAGQTIVRYVQTFDHWIAFFLLAAIGGKMIWDNWRETPLTDDKLQEACPAEPLRWSRLSLLGLATSIDAMAAGVSLSVLNRAIWPAVWAIGLITLTVSFAATLLGRRLGVLFQRNACILGGGVLILIGVSIIIEPILA